MKKSIVFGTFYLLGFFAHSQVTRFVSPSGIDEGNDCSIEALPCASITHAHEEANSGDIIELEIGVYTEAGITINKDVSVLGQSALNTVIQADESLNTSTNRIFHTLSNTTIENISVRFGNANDGGAILNDGALTIKGVHIYNNATSSFGGGIFNRGTLIFNNSTINNNTASAGGGIFTGGISTLENSTISGNTSNFNGGGIFNDDGGELEINNCTITGNTAGSLGDGIYNDNGIFSTYSSIIAGNITIDFYTDDEVNDPVNSIGFNLIGNASGFPSLITDQVGVTTPGLEPLINNGGTTPTHALQMNSPAVDNGDCSVTGITQDQRGVNRPQDGDNNNEASCDVGSFELGTQNPLFEVDGTVIIRGGFPGQDKVLTSNEEGLGTWKNHLETTILNALSEKSSANLNLVGAIEYCRTLTEGGHSDWHLPTLEELAFFIGTVQSNGEFLWTRTALPPLSGSFGRWIILRPEDGDTGNEQHSAIARKCRCVR